MQELDTYFLAVSKTPKYYPNNAPSGTQFTVLVYKHDPQIPEEPIDPYILGHFHILHPLGSQHRKIIVENDLLEVLRRTFPECESIYKKFNDLAVLISRVI